MTLPSRTSRSGDFSDFWMHTRKRALKYSSENWYISPMSARSAIVK
jgi:hypothetical protein